MTRATRRRLILNSLFINGAEEGTRTPTPLRVHGPEPCASANSATSARETCQARTAQQAASLSFAKPPSGVKLRRAPQKTSVPSLAPAHGRRREHGTPCL